MAGGRKGRFSGRGRNAEKEEAASKGAEAGSTTDEKSNLAASESSFGSGHGEQWTQGELVREIETILLLVIFKLQNDYVLVYEFPTNIAAVNLVTVALRVFFSPHYSNPCPWYM